MNRYHKFGARAAKPIKERMDTTGFGLPKPGPREKSQPKDGRLIESAQQYRKTKQQMWRDQNGICGKCGKRMPSPAYGHRHHPGGRGLGGGKRDDSKTVLWCVDCHHAEHEKLNSGKEKGLPYL